MVNRPLGRTGASVSVVGFGAWAIGGAGWAFAWGAQDDNDSIAQRTLLLRLEWPPNAKARGNLRAPR